MADATIPFKGKFYFDDEVAGAENNDMSNNMIDFTYTPDKTKIPIGPKLATNHRKELVGSTGVTVNFTLCGLTNAQVLQFTTDWDAATLMEIQYMAETGAVIGSPTTSIMQVTVQFYMVNPPTLPGVQDEDDTWSPGDILATYFLLDDGASPVTIGTAA